MTWITKNAGMQLSTLSFISATRTSGLEVPTRAVTPAAEDQWKPILEQIVDYGNLGNDWDGLGAKAPTASVISSAIELARALDGQQCSAPSVMVSADGTILFIWDEGPVYLDAEITGPSCARWMQAVKGQKARHWILDEFTAERIRTMGPDRTQPTLSASHAYPRTVTPVLTLTG